MHILISTSSFAQTEREPLELLEAAGITYTLNPHGRKLKTEESIALLQDAAGIIAGTETLDRTVLTGAQKLRVISRVGTGLDNIDLETARELGIAVYSTPDAVVDAVAELTVGGMLSVLRHTARTDHLIRAGDWDKRMGGLLRGKTVGIIGLGRVGKQVARLLQPFGVRLLAFDAVQDDGFAGAYGVEYTELDELVRAADVLTLHLTYSPPLYHLLNRERLLACKPGAIVVNCARGGFVDEAALYDALCAGHLGGAYLDTFEQEPYTGALTKLDNVLLTAHMGSYAAECRAQMELEAAQNLLKHFEKNADRNGNGKHG